MISVYCDNIIIENDSLTTSCIVHSVSFQNKFVQCIYFVLYTHVMNVTKY